MKKEINKSTHYWELDYIRFVAAFSVMTLHYWIRGYAKGDTISPFHFPEVGPKVQYYYLAVNLFFMISGFVIFMSTEKFSSKKPDISDAINFIRSRALRLYPAFWLCCTLTYAATHFLMPNLFNISFLRYAANLTMLNGATSIGNIDGLYWTLWIEIKFYLLMSAAIALGAIKFPTALITLLTAISAANLSIESQKIESIFFTSYLPYFCAGSIFYLIKKKKINNLAIPLIAINYYLGLRYDIIRLAEKESHYGLPFSQLTLAIYIAAFFALMWLTGKMGENKFPRLATALGAISYPLYLIHNNIGMVIFNKANGILPPWMIVSLTMVFMVAVAYAICELIEPKIRNTLDTVWHPIKSGKSI